MKLWTDLHVFSHPWEVMVEAAYRKYPNPHSPHMKSLDTLERRVTPRRLYSNRLVTSMWSVIPSIVLQILGTNPTVRVHEQSMCDLERKTLTLCSTNITLSNLFTLHETLEYSVNPEDPNTTVLKQTAKISVFGIPLLGDILERLLFNNYGSTVSQARVGVEVIADKIREELETVAK